MSDTPTPDADPGTGPDDGPATGPGAAARPPRSPKRGMAAAVLSLEAITLGLTTPVMIAISDVAVPVALAVGLGLALVCLVLAGMLRSPAAYAVGWAVQVAALGLGFVVPVMFLLGAVFAALWAGAVLLGARIERERAEAYAAHAAQAGHPGQERPTPPAAPAR